MSVYITSAVIGVLILVLVSVYLTRVLVTRRDRRVLRRRIEGLLPPIRATRNYNDLATLVKQVQTEHFFAATINKVVLSHVSITTSQLIFLSTACATIGALIFTSLDVPVFGTITLSSIAFVLPAIVFAIIGNKKREKFIQQLPNAIDLFISVLKSGHSIPQAIKAVAEEMQAPCGPEFNEVLQRINLGQSLPNALAISSNKYQSFELDLISRATAIQMEVGGSLADLLEKTNKTLRERLTLKRHILVLTASSRLTAWIVGIMPFVIGAIFSYLNPQYMSPLFETDLGKGLMVLAVVLEIIGILVMRKLCYLKV